MAGSVLETFFFLFESDAKELHKDFITVGQSADDLSDDIEGVFTEVNTLNDGFSDLVKTAGGVVTALIAMSGIAETLAIAMDIDKLGKFTDMLDLNIEQVGAWGQAVIRSGGDAQSFNNTISSLTSGLQQIAITGTSQLTPFFSQFGIEVFDANLQVRDALDILPDLAEAFEGLTNVQAAEFGKNIGIDEGTIRLLQMGRREVDIMVKRQKELGVVTVAQKEASAELNNALADTLQVFGSLSRELLVDAMPAIRSVLEVLTKLGKWLRENKDLINKFFLVAAASLLIYALRAKSAEKDSQGLIGVLGDLAFAFAGALVIEDIISYFKGEESEFGKAIKRYPKLKKVVDDLRDAYKKFVEFDFGDFFDGIGEDIDGLITKLSAFKDALSAILEFTPPAMGFKLFKFLFGSDDEDEKPGFFKESNDNELADNGDKHASLMTKDLGNDLAMGNKLLNQASNSSIASQTPASILNSVSNNNRGDINIAQITVQTAATDADGIASSIKDVLIQQIRAAINSSDDGVVA